MVEFGLLMTTDDVVSHFNVLEMLRKSEEKGTDCVTLGPFPWVNIKLVPLCWDQAVNELESFDFFSFFIDGSEAALRISATVLALGFDCAIAMKTTEGVQALFLRGIQFWEPQVSAPIKQV